MIEHTGFQSIFTLGSGLIIVGKQPNPLRHSATCGRRPTEA
jgi:hypothetical protein